MTTTNLNKIKEVYGAGKGNWVEIQEFPGATNFGYWTDELLNPISLANRIKASVALYEYIVNMLHLTNKDVLVELGCGGGAGMFGSFNVPDYFTSPDKTQSSAKVYAQPTPKYAHCDTAQNVLGAFPHMQFKYFIGIDISQAQIERAIHRKEFLRDHYNKLTQCEEDSANKQVEVTDLKTLTQDKSATSIHASRWHPMRYLEALSKTQTEEVELNKKLDLTEFIKASVLSTGMQDHSVNKAFSVEIMQHIHPNDMTTFSSEVKRILAPKGEFVFCAHFARTQESYNKLQEEKTSLSDIDYAAPIELVKDSFKNNGFNIECHSIGQHVFPGFESWIVSMGSQATEISHKVWQTYIDGDIDYYACKASLSGSLEKEGGFNNDNNKIEV